MKKSGTERIKKNGATQELMTITPAMATEWLSHCVNNRKVSQKYVNRLVAQMAAGKWHITNAAIAFDRNGQLVDGQHRLWAVLLSDVSIVSWVCRGIDPDAVMSIDTAKVRNLPDILRIGGENGKVTNNEVATMRRMLASFGNAPDWAPEEYSRAMARHHKAVQFAVDNLPTVTSARGVNTGITRAVVARAWYTQDRARLAQFCRKLTSGIVTSEEESIIVGLRQYLQENRGGSFTSRMQRYGKIEKVLALWLAGENPSRVYAVSNEQFPLPGEVA